MKINILILLILFMVVIANSQEAEKVVNYKIKAKLDPLSKTIEGYEIINWKNMGTADANDLCFHLYMNAFKNNKTYFMRESKGMHRRNTLKKGKWGYIEIDSIALADGRSLKDRIKIDDTIMKVDLYEPVQPGKDIFLEISFKTKLPEVFARTGYSNDFFMVGQWFPKIAVYENNKWNCHYFHANSEFYSDFGSYNVDITVPKEYLVAATGNLIGKAGNEDNTITYSYIADNVHDFAWAASPDFMIATDRFDNIEIQLYYFRSHKRCVDRYLKSIKAALNYFGQWYGKYPYSKITIIDPPFNAAGAGGMEYPTLITGGCSALMPEKFHAVEFVTVHEFCHQYWYGMVANNEFEEAWLDEGFTSYSTAKAINEMFGQSGNLINLLGYKISALDSEKIQYLMRLDYDPIYKKSWLYYDNFSYSVNSYSKPALLLFTLENFIGSDRMREVLNDYFRRYKFKHPKTKDFIKVFEEHVGDVYNEFINKIIYGTGVVDFAVESLKAEKVPPNIGFFMKDGKLVELNEENNKNNKNEQYENEVVIKRKGDIPLLVDIEFIFDDGKVVRKKWDAKERWIRFTFIEKQKIKCAVVDPADKILLDINRVNNSMCRDANNRFLMNYRSTLMYYVQYLTIKLLNFF